MTQPPVEVVMYQTAADCKAWVVEMWKMGARLHLFEHPEACKRIAEARGKALAEFLDIPFRELAERR